MSFDWGDAVALAALAIGIHQYWRQSLRRPNPAAVPPRSFNLQRLVEEGPYEKTAFRWMLWCGMILTNDGARPAVISAMRLTVPGWQKMTLLWTATLATLQRGGRPDGRELAGGVVLQPHSATRLVAEFQYGGPGFPNAGAGKATLEGLVRIGGEDFWRPLGTFHLTLDEAQKQRALAGEEVSVSLDPFRHFLA